MEQSAIVLKGKAHGSDGDENKAPTFMNNRKIFNLARARARACLDSLQLQQWPWPWPWPWPWNFAS